MTKQATSNKRLITLLSIAMYLSIPTAIFAENKDKVSIVTFSGVIENKKDIEESLPDDVNFATKEEAIKTDNEILAKETGLPIELVTNAMLFQEAFGKYADKLLHKYPEQISAVYLDGEFSSQKGFVKFIGKVPKELQLQVKRFNQSNQIVLSSGGKISMNEHKKRARLINESLEKLNYKNTIVFYDFKKSLMDIKIKLPNNVKEPIKSDLINNLAKFISTSELKSKNIYINEENLKLTIDRSSKPIITLDKTRGGSLIYRDGSSPLSKCTSGWSVIAPGLGLGVLTAGHCMFSGKDTIVKHASGGGTITTYPMEDFDTELYSLSGWDVGIYDTPTTGEEYKFWAKKNQVRYVWDKKSTNSMVGSRVCMYGRSSNIRTCNHTVTAIGVYVGMNTSVGIRHIRDLASTTNNSAQNGDSGGGWSYSTIAWGVQSGHSGTTSYFTPIEVAEDRLSAELF